MADSFSNDIAKHPQIWHFVANSILLYYKGHISFGRFSDRRRAYQGGIPILFALDTAIPGRVNYPRIDCRVGLLAEKASLNSSRSQPLRQGLVQVYTGDGKGKTSAALGAVLRAIGQGLRVYIVFFMKGAYPYGERAVLGKMPGVTEASFGRKW